LKTAIVARSVDLEASPQRPLPAQRALRFRCLTSSIRAIAVFSCSMPRLCSFDALAILQTSAHRK
jgi:hypothetical protein